MPTPSPSPPASRSALTAAPTGDPQSITVPFWNVWFEQYTGSSTPKFEPAATLKPNSDVTLILDLAALSFNDVRIQSRPVSTRLAQRLQRISDPNVILTVLAVPDPKFFSALPADERVRELKIDAMKLTSWSKSPDSAAASNPFEALRLGHGEATFDLDHRMFHLVTRGHEGTGSIALAIWARNAQGIFPIDELTVRVCISSRIGSSACGATTTDTLGLNAPGMLEAATFDHTQPIPDIALQFIELKADSVIGVLRCNTCSQWQPNEFETWDLGRSTEYVLGRLSEIMANVETAAADSDTTEPVNLRPFSDGGRALRNLLFPTTMFIVHSTAEKRFTEAVAELLARGDAARPPRLFVSLVSQPDRPQFLVPLGLMTLKIQGTEDFIGFHFRVETPLLYQDYTRGKSCLKRWSLLVPPENIRMVDGPLEPARDQVRDWIETFKHSADTKVMDSIEEFSTWIAPDSDVQPVPPGGYALTVLSHHEHNMLFFNGQTKSPAVFADDFRRRDFEVPSLAILDACGTGSPAAYVIAQNLNEKGVSTIIATSTKVDPELAGRFLDLLLTQVRDHGKSEGFDIGQARYAAIRALRELPESRPSGPKALLFSLAGNGNLPVCLPDQSPSREPAEPAAAPGTP